MSADAVLKTLAVNTLDISGVTRLLRPFYEGKGSILLFHRVLPDSAPTLIPGLAVTVSYLRSTLEFVKRRGMDFVSLSEVPERLRSAGRFIVITFDDGFLDNLELGLPVFREFGAPFSVFPTTSFVNRDRIPWTLLLEALSLHTDRFALRHPERGQIEFVRSKKESRLAFFRRVKQCGWSAAELESCLAPACEAAGISTRELGDRLFLSWDQVRTLDRDPLATIGAHTVTHPKLSRLSEIEAEQEMIASREELQRRLGSPVRHFAYPFGTASDCGPREFGLAGKLGFTTGLTTKRGNLRTDHLNGLHSLPRQTLSMVPHGRSMRYLRISLDGIWDSPVNGTILTR